MTDPSIAPPTRGGGDVAHLVGKALLSAIPGAGGPLAEVFQFVVTPPIERRRDEVVAAIGERLVALEALGIKLEDLRDNPVFIDTVLDVAQIAIRTSQEEKRVALFNALQNAGLPHAPEQSLQQMFLGWVEDFTVWHLRVLTLFHDPAQWSRENAHRFPELSMRGMTSAMDFMLEAAYPELKGKRSFYDQIWQDLHARGSVNTTGLHSSMNAIGLMARRTTELGGQFLAFIEAPPTP